MAEAVGGSQGFWGSRDAAGHDVMVNLRLVAYARASPVGTALVFLGGDVLEVQAPMPVVSRRLYAAFDDRPIGDGKDDKGDDDEKV